MQRDLHHGLLVSHPANQLLERRGRETHALDPNALVA